MRISDWISDVCSSDLLLYGDDHAYGIPFTGSGTEAGIASLARDELVAYQQQWLRPENATVVVVGDTTLAEIVPVLDRHFGDWKGSGDAPAHVTVAKVERPAAARVFLIDQPGALQANIFAGKVRSEEHTSELQSLMRIPYAVSCLI